MKRIFQYIILSNIVKTIRLEIMIYNKKKTTNRQMLAEVKRIETGLLMPSDAKQNNKKIDSAKPSCPYSMSFCSALCLSVSEYGAR